MIRHLFITPSALHPRNHLYIHLFYFSKLLFLVINYTVINLFTFRHNFCIFHQPVYFVSISFCHLFRVCVCVCSRTYSACSSMYLLSIFSVYLKISFSRSLSPLHFFSLLRYSNVMKSQLRESLQSHYQFRRSHTHTRLRTFC